MKIPKEYKLGADTIKVSLGFDKKIIEEGHMGEYSRDLCEIRLVTGDGLNTYPEDTIEDTFYHEKVHSILKFMGHELNTNEEFVDLFAKLLRQSDVTSVY